ncbi:substrate-binding domain-containing protein [Variovorax sp. LjRoot84]|uniref:substrate-binding domain-containing protein n=1 Tax=Variovorax sp. LjRoot84 TaxID=3342340 RepID=UPI003ECFB03A
MKPKLCVPAVVLCLFLGSAAQAAPPSDGVCAGSPAERIDPALPAYEPRAVELAPGARYFDPDGAVAVVGYNDMREMLESLTASFSATHRNIRFRLDLPGTRFAPAALARGVSAFAPMGALFTPQQLEEYLAIARSEPIAVRIAHASLDARALSGPLAVFVHRDNPIRFLTLAQVAKVFSGDAARWSELGLQGAWAGRGLNAYGMQPDTALAFELQQMVMPHTDFGPRMVGVPQSAELVEKVASDPSAIGFAAAMRATPAVRAVPIAAAAGAEAVAPTCEDIVAGRYPLDRHLLIYVPQPVTPLAREFVRFALSREGQQAIAASPQGYLPMSAKDAAAQRAKVE